MSETLTVSDISLKAAKDKITPLVDAYDAYYQAVVDWVEAMPTGERAAVERAMDLFGTSNCGWDAYRVSKDVAAELSWRRRARERA